MFSLHLAPRNALAPRLASRPAHRLAHLVPRLLHLAFTAVAVLAALAACKRRDYNAPWAGGLPLAADANRDGVEDLIGERGGLVALDGRTYRPLWQRQDLPLVRDGHYRALAIAGDTLAVGSARSLHLLDLASGQTRATLELSDQVTWLCGADHAIWVQQLDERRGLVELGAGATAARLDETAAPPAACADRGGHRHYACDHAAAGCASPPGLTSMTLTDRASASPTTLTIELKSPGTPEVSLVLPDGQRVLYDREGARLHAADLAAGHLFLKRVGAVHALDAATGRPLWAVPCAGNTPLLRRSEERRVGKECRRLCRSRWSPYH
jgi:outer membrane protein assembly factor BamB